MQKNFKYGDTYELTAEHRAKLASDSVSREYMDPTVLTKNRAFLNFLKEHNYHVVLDYGYDGFAHTDPQRREIVLNARFSNHTLSALLQHEMGHLLLFNVNMFTTVTPMTLRSVISRVIYTPGNVVDYGIGQLMHVENIIQDIIIETVSDGRCVCNAIAAECGKPAGVKHLEFLESAGFIAAEVCKNELKKLNRDGGSTVGQLTAGEAEAIRQALKSMIDDLLDDINEAQTKLDELQTSGEFLSQAKNTTYNEIVKVSDQKRKLKAKIDKLESAGKQPSPSLSEMMEKLQQQIKDLNSTEREQADAAQAAAKKERAIKNLDEKITELMDLLTQLGQQLEQLENQRTDGGAGCDGACDGAYDGEGDRKGDSESGSKNAASKSSGSSMEAQAVNDDGPAGTGHGFNCGLPHPKTVTRSGSAKNAEQITVVGSPVRGRTQTALEIDLDMVADHQARKKSPEKEFTYFKANKKEADATDMLKGKRRLRVSGLNVLIGLDISGSMTHEWTTLFKDISARIEALKSDLDIDEIVYFTYNHTLQEQSTDLTELRIAAHGGNSFGQVYQQICLELPIFNKNEIILITDCGDNLGFDLDAVCKVTRNNQPVQTHITICDTEGAGFYYKENFDERYWDLRHIGDLDLFDQIKTNINNLIMS